MICQYTVPYRTVPYSNGAATMRLAINKATVRRQALLKSSIARRGAGGDVRVRYVLKTTTRVHSPFVRYL